MMPLDVELLRKTDPGARGRGSGLGAPVVAVLGLIAAGSFGAHGWVAHRQAAAVAEVIPPAVSDTQVTRRVAEAPPPAHLADAQRLARAGAFDVGELLGVLESIREPAVRMTSLEVQPFDATARVHFELEDVSGLATVMSALTGSSPGLSWQVVAVEAPRDGRPGSLRLQARRGDFAPALPAQTR